MKLGVFALGCKVNTFEIQAIAALAQQRGHEIVNRNAEVFLINTCTVTAMSDHKNLRALRKIHKENPQAQLAAFGCLAQIEGEALKQTANIAAVFGTSSRDEIVTLCEQLHQKQLDAQLVARTFAPEKEMSLLPAGVPQGRTRALLKIEDGCDNYCSYCIIPYARGHVRSLPLETAVAECERLASAGVREIIITGIEISSYGRDLSPKRSLLDLLVAICEAVPAVSIRLGSLEPRTVDVDFCASLSAYPNLIPHFHLSLQSGCDTTLAHMRRRYNTAQLYKIVTLLRQFFPNCSLTADLIVGFPDETDRDFIKTLEFIENCAFADVHVFPYSPRIGTPAATMEGQIPQEIKEDRADQARFLVEEMSFTHRAERIGQTVRVLMEHPTVDGYWCGHTTANFPVYAPSAGSHKNKYCTVRLIAHYKDGMLGDIITYE